MKFIQDEILHGGDNIQLTWTPHRLISLTAMVEVLVYRERWTACVKLTLTNKEQKDQLITYNIWFEGRSPRVNNSVEISPDTLYSTCCHWSHINL